MFTRLLIELTEPICDCERNDVYWSIETEGPSDMSLTLSCGTCGTSLHVPSSKLDATVTCERRASLVGLAGGKVLALPPRNDKDDDHDAG